MPPQEGSRRLRDADVCTMRSLLHELETVGIVDYAINGHTCERPAGLLFGAKT